LTYPRQEKNKNELVSCARSEWAKPIHKQFFLERCRTKRRADKVGVPADVAIGSFIQHSLKQKDVEVDFIFPKEVSKERLKSNDLNFLLIYDLLESFHTDTSVDKPTYNNLKACLLEAKNVYPPRAYQDFVCSKITYYNYLKRKNVNILPTFTMTTKEYNELGPDAAMKKVLEYCGREGLSSVIGKPEHGQESRDIAFFPNLETDLMSKYFQKCTKKYPGFVLQKMVKGFGNSAMSPELRMYYMGNKYHYSVCAGDRYVRTPKAEGGNLKTPLKKLKAVTQKILKKLPPMVMPNGARLPRLITRLDMGYIVDGKYKPFINEVEYVPSLYSEDVSRENIHGYIAGCASQMVKITRQYVRSCRASRKPSLNKARKFMPLKPRKPSAVLKPHMVKRKLKALVRNAGG